MPGASSGPTPPSTAPWSPLSSTSKASTPRSTGLPGRYAPPSGCLLLAMYGDIPAGCVALRDLGHGTCEMKRLYVTPEHRGLGLGRLLVEAVLLRAGRMGYRRMVLDSLPEIAGALALYRQHGFVETAPYWGHPTGHAIFMERSLGLPGS